MSGDTQLVLTNAIYFKGAWLHEFDAARTGDDQFRVTATETVPVRMMRLSMEGTFFEGDGVQVLRLPYRGNAKSMLLIVPKEVEGLAAVEAKLTAALVAKWRAGLAEGDAHLELPKFMGLGGASLAGTLSKLGMPLAFDPQSADFSGVADGQRLCLSDVIHKAVIEVDERGTVAAAATATATTAASAPGERTVRRQISVRADRPFLYLVVDDATQAILFVGRVAKP